MSLKDFSEALHVFSPTNSATTPQVALTAIPFQRVKVYRLILTLAGTAGTVQLQDTNAVALSHAFQLGITGGISLDVPFNYDPWWVTVPSVGFQFAITGGGTLGWDLWYLQK